MATYLVAVLVAASLSFFKLLVLVSLFPSESFGHYISLYGIAIFLSSLVSFGSVEHTLKSFPRYLSRGELDIVNRAVKDIFLTLFNRFIVITLLIIAMATTFSFQYTAIQLLLCVAVAFSASTFALFASIFRATNNVNLQVYFVLTRAITTFLFVYLLAACTGSWQAALTGDIFAALLLIYIFKWQLKQQTGIIADIGGALQIRPKAILDAKSFKLGGGAIFLTFLFSNAITNLDKFYISEAFGAEAAGRYGALAILIQISLLFLNAVTQRVGVEFILLEQQQGSLFKQLRLLARWVAVFYGLLTLGWAVVFTLLQAGIFDRLIQQYEINTHLVLLVAIMCFLQAFTIIDFLLVAKNKEIWALRAALAAVCVAILGAAHASLNDQSVAVFVGSLIAARTVQIVFQLVGLAHLKKTKLDLKDLHE